MFKHCLIVFLVSMVPIIELRGAIPYGVGFGLPLWLTYIVAIVGNMLPVPLIYFFARRILEWGQDKPVIGKFFTFCLDTGALAGTLTAVHATVTFPVGPDNTETQFELQDRKSVV